MKMAFCVPSVNCQHFLKKKEKGNVKMQLGTESWVKMYFSPKGVESDEK